MYYNPETHGNLLNYLRTHHGGSADNAFIGSKYFFVIKDAGLLIPFVSFTRVGYSHAPDNAYFVNSDFLLESRGGENTMQV